MSNADPIEVEAGDLQIVELEASELARVQDVAALDVQVTTAKSYPRSIKSFHADLEAWATFSQEVAEECFYAVPRAGKTLIGPSIRFAELVECAYTNLATEARVIEVGRRTVRVQATCRDMERNIAMRVEAERSIVDKEGVRFSPDMIQVTTNAAISLALRNAIIRVVPKALWLPIWQKCREVAVGKGRPFSETRDAAVEWLKKTGVTEERILAKTGKASIKDLDADDILFFKSVSRHIRDGETTPEQAFPEPREPKGASAAAINKKLGLDPKEGSVSQEALGSQTANTSSQIPPAPVMIRVLCQCGAEVEEYPLGSRLPCLAKCGRRVVVDDEGNVSFAIDEAFANDEEQGDLGV